MEEPEGLDAIADALKACATHLKYLGNGDAATTMGAIEAHGVMVKEAGENIAEAIRELASAISRRP